MIRYENCGFHYETEDETEESLDAKFALLDREYTRIASFTAYFFRQVFCGENQAKKDWASSIVYQYPTIAIGRDKTKLKLTLDGLRYFKAKDIKVKIVNNCMFTLRPTYIHPNTNIEISGKLICVLPSNTLQTNDIAFNVPDLRGLVIQTPIIPLQTGKFLSVEIFPLTKIVNLSLSISVSENLQLEKSAKAVDVDKTDEEGKEGEDLKKSEGVGADEGEDQLELDLELNEGSTSEDNIASEESVECIVNKALENLLTEVQSKSEENDILLRNIRRVQNLVQSSSPEIITRKHKNQYDDDLHYYLNQILSAKDGKSFSSISDWNGECRPNSQLEEKIRQWHSSSKDIPIEKMDSTKICSSPLKAKTTKISSKIVKRVKANLENGLIIDSSKFVKNVTTEILSQIAGFKTEVVESPEKKIYTILDMDLQRQHRIENEIKEEVIEEVPENETIEEGKKCGTISTEGYGYHSDDIIDDCFHARKN